MDRVGRRLALGLILAGSFLFRLHQLNAPLLDGMAVKQLFVAHKARGIAGPPFAPLHHSFDFLTEGGGRLRLCEEFPLYASLVAAGYRVFGEGEWFARLLSSVAMLAATVALYDLVRREFDTALALSAALFFAFSPLLLFYGRTVQPDAAMLALMLLAASCFSRHLASGHLRWWLATAACGAVAALFKYYGLAGCCRWPSCNCTATAGGRSRRRDCYCSARSWPRRSRSGWASSSCMRRTRRRK